MTQTASSDALEMPRRLAIRLLHEAQIATEPFAGIVTAASRGNGEPEGWRRADADASLSAIVESLPALGHRAWAVYAYRPALPTAPAVADFAAWPGLLRLSASLATKGVLQLRAWECRDGRVVERALHIHD